MSVILLGLSAVGAMAIIVVGIVAVIAFWPCKGSCRYYWDYLGSPDPGCWKCKRKERKRDEERTKKNG